MSRINKKNLKCFVIIALMLICCISRAFIYDIRVMRKWDTKYNHYCYFIGLGDFHDKQHKITGLQKKQIDAIVQRCVPLKTKIILEDISSVGSKGKKCCKNFYINSTGGILGGLTSRCKKKGISSVENIEYRFCRVISLAPVIKNIQANYKRFLPTSSIKIDNFRSEVAGVFKEILGYKDNPVLQNWYKKCVTQVRNNMNLFKFDTMSKMNIADYIYYNTNNNVNNLKNRFRFVKRLLTFDSCLIDAKIVHSIVVSPEKQNALVIAGGSHIRNVSRVLQSIGFVPVYRSKVLLKREYDVKKCLGCHVAPGGFCNKPEPANLKVLNRFI